MALIARDCKTAGCNDLNGLIRYNRRIIFQRSAAMTCNSPQPLDWDLYTHDRWVSRPYKERACQHSNNPFVRRARPSLQTSRILYQMTPRTMKSSAKGVLALFRVALFLWLSPIIAQGITADGYCPLQRVKQHPTFFLLIKRRADVVCGMQVRAQIVGQE